MLLFGNFSCRVLIKIQSASERKRKKSGKKNKVISLLNKNPLKIKAERNWNHSVTWQVIASLSLARYRSDNSLTINVSLKCSNKDTHFFGHQGMRLTAPTGNKIERSSLSYNFTCARINRILNFSPDRSLFESDFCSYSAIRVCSSVSKRHVLWSP